MRETKATISGAQLIHILQLWKSCYLWRQPHNRGLVTSPTEDMRWLGRPFSCLHTSCHTQIMEKQQDVLETYLDGPRS